MTKILVGNLKGPQGDPGEPGEPGADGQGIDTTGATEGQVPAYIGGTIQWVNPPGATGGIAGAPTAWPSSFPPALHSHPATQLSDSTSVGRAVITAADQQAARAAIGAGTGNGNSNLQIGTSGTTAAAGNHGHNASNLGFTPTGDISATNVQDAIVQAAASGGGGGGGAAVSNVLVVKYASGAYPALPATKPSGVQLILFIGPVAPTSGNVSGGFPSYIGDGATQIMADYEWRNLT